MTAVELMSTALLTLNVHQQATPCADGSQAWTSEDRDVRAHAARRCRCCPLLDVCGQYADAVDASFGVWAGHDRS